MRYYVTGPNHFPGTQIGSNTISQDGLGVKLESQVGWLLRLACGACPRADIVRRCRGAVTRLWNAYRTVFTRRSSITSPRSSLRKDIVTRPPAVEAMLSIANQ